MRDANDVTVEHAIVHIVDHGKPEPILSELELDLNGNNALKEYFSSQVENALGDPQTGSALFSEEGDQAAQEACFHILEEESFILSSQELARLLWAAMGKDQRIVPGSLAVMLYTASNYPDITFLALIKLDPGRALVQRVATQGGKQVVTFDVRGDVLPTTHEKLHKAALIPPRGFSAEFHLLLLDRQVAAVAANFFARKFLNTVPAIDPRTLTDAFYAAAQNAYNVLSFSPPEGVTRITPAEGVALQQHTNYALQTPAVNTSSWVAKLPLPKEARAVVAEQIKKRLPEDVKIEIDQTYARDKLLKKTRFRGDYGVLFEVELQHVDDVVKKRTEKKNPAGTIVTVLQIEVPHLEWVK
jgi:hypothetical protein